ncbi:MAG TPA: HAD hydrolase-like protein [Candidatus Limnocylindrales bacterium]
MTDAPGTQGQLPDTSAPATSTRAFPHVVMFDLDGTLSDPLVGIGRSINYALSSLGYEPLELAQLAVYIGPPLDHTFRAITGEQSPARAHAFVAKYRERYAEVGYSENVLYPGIREALADLTEAGILLGVCTSKPVDFAERILEMFGLRSLFRFVSGGEMIGTEKWQQIESLLKQGSIDASTVMVGDRSIDLVAAHRNGLSAAGVLWGFGSRNELELERPRYLLSSPNELQVLGGYPPSLPAPTPNLPLT